MNEERTGKCLQQVVDIRGHLLDRYSITVKPSHGDDRKILEVITSAYERVIPGPPREILQGGTTLLWGPGTG
jgi:hypothetical protein